MEPFRRVEGAAAPLPGANIDTDVIMPKQFLKGIDREGLGLGALHDLRFTPEGKARPGFVLNQEAWRDARFLVVGPNFGCGSSREHAVWGLLQLGIRAVIGTSFAGIFADNAANNGLLLVSLSPEAHAPLLPLASTATTNWLAVDLERQQITATAFSTSFSIDALRKNRLTKGLDRVSATLEQAALINDFERSHHEASPWLRPSS